MDALGWVVVAAVMAFVVWMRIRLYGLSEPKRATARDVVTVVGVALLLFATFGAVEAFLIDR